MEFEGTDRDEQELYELAQLYREEKIKAEASALKRVIADRVDRELNTRRQQLKMLATNELKVLHHVVDNGPERVGFRHVLTYSLNGKQYFHEVNVPDLTQDRFSPTESIRKSLETQLATHLAKTLLNDLWKGLDNGNTTK